jgi:hypothetical protein
MFCDVSLSCYFFLVVLPCGSRRRGFPCADVALADERCHFDNSYAGSLLELDFLAPFLHCSNNVLTLFSAQHTRSFPSCYSVLTHDLIDIAIHDDVASFVSANQ